MVDITIEWYHEPDGTVWARLVVRRDGALVCDVSGLSLGQVEELAQHWRTTAEEMRRAAGGPSGAGGGGTAVGG